MSLLAITAAGSQDPASPFAGADVCRHAGLTLPPGTRRPGFDDDLWDFTDVTGLPASMPLAVRRFDFTLVTSPRWRTVAKELIFAMLAPRHEAVALLPRAARIPVHLRTAYARLGEASRFLNWLAGQGVSSLGEVGSHHCETYLFHRRHALDEHGTVVGERSPGTRRRGGRRTARSGDRYPAVAKGFGRPPELQQQQQRAERDQRADDVGQVRPEELRGRELAEDVGQGAHHGQRPDAPQAAAARDQVDEDPRRQQRENRHDPAHRGGQAEQRHVGDGRQRDGGAAECTSDSA